MKDDALTPAVIAAADALSRALAALLDEFDDERLQALAKLIEDGARPGLRFVARTGAMPPEVTFMLVSREGNEVPFAHTHALRALQ